MGPYIITVVYGSREYQLATPKGESLEDLINIIHLHRFNNCEFLRISLKILKKYKKIKKRPKKDKKKSAKGP